MTSEFYVCHKNGSAFGMQMTTEYFVLQKKVRHKNLWILQSPKIRPWHLFLCWAKNGSAFGRAMTTEFWILCGTSAHIPCVSFFCNPRTVEPTHTFQEQLIVVKNQFLAARKNNSISQAARNYFILLRAAQNNIGCFSHVTKLANLRVENTSFQSNTK